MLTFNRHTFLKQCISVVQSNLKFKYCFQQVNPFSFFFLNPFSLLNIQDKYTSVDSILFTQQIP